MKECVIKVQTQHHLDVIVGRVRSLGGKYEHYKYTAVNSKTMYTTYQGWLYQDLPVYVWLTSTDYAGLKAYLHNHDCGCKVFNTVQDAIEYLGLDIYSSILRDAVSKYSILEVLNNP